jgi:hypothetical protein
LGFSRFFVFVFVFAEKSRDGKARSTMNRDAHSAATDASAFANAHDERK